MSSEAVTLNASRTYPGGVMVTWTPSTTETALDVMVTVGAAYGWHYSFNPDNTEGKPEGGSNTWNLDSGTFTVEFSADGKHGTLFAHEWKYTVNGSQYRVNGQIGNW